MLKARGERTFTIKLIFELQDLPDMAQIKSETECFLSNSATRPHPLTTRLQGASGEAGGAQTHGSGSC